MARVRTFLAVNFPLVAVRRMADEARAVAPAVVAAGLEVTWVPAANLHLTVKFLGDVEREAVEAIRGRLARGLPAHAPFDIEARGLGAFPDPRRPRVIWIGVTPAPALAALQQDIEAWMQEIGFAKEERAFHPHVTLGRVKGGRGSIEALAAERDKTLYGVGRVGEVVIYESRTMRAGAEYHALGRVPLGDTQSTGTK